MTLVDRIRELVEFETSLNLELDLEDEKTDRMKLLERRFGRPIRMLIEVQENKTGAEIAHELGISEGVLSQWRKRFGLEGIKRGRPAKR